MNILESRLSRAWFYWIGLLDKFNLVLISLARSDEFGIISLAYQV